MKATVDEKSLENTKTLSDANDPKTTIGISKEVVQEISCEINNMISFAVYNGIIINTDINALIQSDKIDDLIKAHNLLCENVAPATPKSIHFIRLINKKGASKSLFNKLPLIRNLVLLSVLFLIFFVSTALSSEVNNNSLDRGVLDNNGLSLLLNLGFLASVAGLGVLFYLLKNISTSVKNGTLVPEDTIYYVSMIILGIISGLICSEIITFGAAAPHKINLFNKSMLALVGGFSSDAIFSVLQGVIDRVKSVFIAAEKS